MRFPSKWKKYLFTITAMSLAFDFSQPTYAQAIPKLKLIKESMSEAEAITFFIKHNPELKLQKLAIESEKAKLAQAKIYPNPSLNYYREDLPFDQESEDQFYLQQQILLGDKMGSRQTYVKQQVNLAKAKYFLNVQQALNRFRKVLLNKAIIEAKLQLFKDFVSHMNEILTIVKKRVNKGESAVYERLRIEIEQERMVNNIVELEQQLKQTHLNIKHLLSVPVKVQSSLTLTKIPSLYHLINQTKTNRAELYVAKQLRSVARSQFNMAEQLSIPDLTALLGLRHAAQQQNHLFGYLLTLTVPIPLADKGKGEKVSAQALLKIAEQQESYWERKLDLEVKECFEHLMGVRKILQHFQEQVLPRKTKLLHIAQVLYKGGEGTLLNLIDAHRLEEESRLRELELLSKNKEAEMKLFQTIGTPVTLKTSLESELKS